MNLLIFSLPLLLARASAAPDAASAVAFSGAAPDDGPGVHIAIGAGVVAGAGCLPGAPPSGAYTMLHLERNQRVPSTITLSTSLAESFHQAADGSRRAAEGTVQLDHIDAQGVHGRYALRVDGQPLSGAFDAPWCGEAVDWGRSRPAQPVAGFVPASHLHQRVTLEGYLVVHDGMPVLASALQETSPSRPTDTIVRLVAGAALTDTVTEVWSDRLRGSAGLVVIEGQVRGESVHVFSVAPSH